MLPQDSIVSELSLSSPTLAGRAYRILRSTEVDVYDKAVQPEELATPFLERLEAPSGDKFRGKARKAAKLAIATAPVEDRFDFKPGRGNDGTYRTRRQQVCAGRTVPASLSFERAVTLP